MNRKHITIVGRPQAKERPRLVHDKVITPKKTKEYEARIKAEYYKKYPEEEKLTGFLSVDVFLFFNKRNHGDVDNYAKIALDGLNGVAWGDDKLVRHVNAFLVVDKQETERMEIFIRTLPDDFEEHIKNKLEKLILDGTNE